MNTWAGCTPGSRGAGGASRDKGGRPALAAPLKAPTGSERPHLQTGRSPPSTGRQDLLHRWKQDQACQLPASNSPVQHKCLLSTYFAPATSRVPGSERGRGTPASVTFPASVSPGLYCSEWGPQASVSISPEPVTKHRFPSPAPDPLS